MLTLTALTGILYWWNQDWFKHHMSCQSFLHQKDKKVRVLSYLTLGVFMATCGWLLALEEAITTVFEFFEDEEFIF